MGAFKVSGPMAEPLTWSGPMAAFWMVEFGAVSVSSEHLRESKWNPIRSRNKPTQIAIQARIVGRLIGTKRDRRRITRLS